MARRSRLSKSPIGLIWRKFDLADLIFLFEQAFWWLAILPQGGLRKVHLLWLGS
jgi:hypothetical protein